MRTYGNIGYCAGDGTPRSKGSWLIKATPHVMGRIKRIIPRANQDRAGYLLLADTPELAADLDWLMDRWPLQFGGTRGSGGVTAAEAASRMEEQVARHREAERAAEKILAGRPLTLALGEPGRPARPYQQAAADLAITVGGLLVGDQIGLGKSFTGALVLGAEGALPGVVVCDTHLPPQWTRELALAWPQLLVHTVAGRTPYDPADKLRGRQPDVLIVPYSRLVGWVDYLAGWAATVLFDEMQDLRHGDSTEKGRAAARLADACTYRVGLSVGPDSIIELVGGPFGAGWVGRIEDATTIVADVARVEQHGDHEFLRVTGIQSRGWTGSGFGWKDVKSFVRHPCTTGATVLRTGSGHLLLTDEHSVYRVEDAGLGLDRADAIRIGDRLAGDDGRHWHGAAEEPVDVLAVAITAGLRDVQVVVDLNAVTRHDVGVTAWEWQNFGREAMHGARLPAAVYSRNAEKLPSPTAVYVSGGRGGRRAAPFIRLSDWAYMLGFYLGDGWTDGHRVGFAVDLPRADEFEAMLRKLPGADVDPSQRPSTGACMQIRFGNPLVAAVIRHALGAAGCHDKAIPGEWIVSWPTAARRELLRGLLDSDGHISGRHGRRCYTTVSKGLANSLLSLLRSLGIPGSIHASDATPGGVVAGRQITGRGRRYSVQWSAFAEAGDNAGWRGNRTRFEWARGLLHESPVRAAGPAATTPATVYDLEMTGHPSFVANGVLVHNTASPVYNYGIEMWNLVNILRPDALGTREEFRREWADDSAKGQVSDPETLGAHLRAENILLARTRKDVGREIPEPLLIEQPTEADVAVLEAAESDAAVLAKFLLDQAGTWHDRGQAAREIDWRLRQATGIAKAPFVAAFVKMLLETEQRVVVFAWHRAVYDLLMEALAEFNPVLYTGSEDVKRKEASRKAFLAGDARVLLMSLRSGKGLDGLQDVCSIAVFAELDWSPETHLQGTGRLWRDGQEATVVAYFCVAADGSDPVLAKYLDIKRMQAEPMMRPGGAVFRPAPSLDRVRALAEQILHKRAGQQQIGGAA